MLAEIAAKIYPTESIVYRIAKMYEENKDVSQEAANVKLFCSEAMVEIADKALQIHGEMGFSRELPLEIFYCGERISKIFEGTIKIQRMVIGRQVKKSDVKW